MEIRIGFRNKGENRCRGTASEVVRELEIRIARLEKSAGPLRKSAGHNTRELMFAFSGYLQSMGVQNISMHGNNLDGSVGDAYFSGIINPKFAPSTRGFFGPDYTHFTFSIVGVNTLYESDDSVNEWHFKFDGKNIIEEVSTPRNTLRNYFQRLRLV